MHIWYRALAVIALSRATRHRVLGSFSWRLYFPIVNTPSSLQPHAACQPCTDLNQYQRSLKERLFHAALFEGFGILFATPLAMWITGKSAVSMAALSAVISAIAMLWNMLFNWLFDRLQHRYGFHRSFLIRILHSCAFELGLIILVVPLVAWWVNTSLLHALLLDIGLILFFLPYAFFYNLIYDTIRKKVVRTRTLTAV